MKFAPLEKYKVRNFWTGIKINDRQNENIKSRIRQLDGRLQQMQLFSNVFTLFACILSVFTIARIYSSIAGKHPLLLPSTLAIMILLFALFLYFKWKSFPFKNEDFKKAGKPGLKYQIEDVNDQYKLISGYLLAYVITIIVLVIFFCRDIHNGLTPLFKSTAPLSLIIYGSGFYLMSNLGRQMQKLELLEKRVDRFHKARAGV